MFVMTPESLRRTPIAPVKTLVSDPGPRGGPRLIRAPKPRTSTTDEATARGEAIGRQLADLATAILNNARGRSSAALPAALRAWIGGLVDGRRSFGWVGSEGE